METQKRRHRSSTATSTAPESAKPSAALQASIEALSQASQPRPDAAYPELARIIPLVKNVSQTIANASEETRVKDDFRHRQGFNCLLTTLRAYSGFYHPTQRSKEDKLQLFDLLGSVLQVLGLACVDHYGNQRYFKHRVEGGGWAALEQTIASIGLGSGVSDTWSESRLIGKLLAFVYDDERLDVLCQGAVELRTTYLEATDVPDKGQRLDDAKGAPTWQELVQGHVKKSMEGLAIISNPAAIPTLFDFWKTIPRPSNADVHPITSILLTSLTEIASLSTRNLKVLHATGILSAMLPLAFDSDSILHSDELPPLRGLCDALITLGVNSLHDAEYILCCNTQNSAEFILKALRKQDSPAHIQFDLSLHGYASIEVPSLVRAFPPPSTQAGYTFMAWFRIDKYDPNTHTTLFGAFDSSQTCFVLAYIEKDTHNFILQTSVTSSKPSVRFKSMSFREGHWYHITVVHRRPKTLASSRAILFVNGEMVEQVKCQYPEPPPLSNASTESFVSFSSSSTKQNPVQAFLGTPQDLSARLGKGAVLSRWSLASAHLIDDVLSDDLIAVYHRLGPRYNGNFQDCLGSFQTYEASAALGMRNELIHPGKDDSSDIISAIRGKAGALMAESRLILSILPTAIIGDHAARHEPQSQLIRGLNRTAGNNLYQLTHGSGTSLAVNAAVPALDEALIRSYGTSVLTGEPVVVIPEPLDDAMWRLGGYSAITLKRIEQAKTPHDLLQAVEILFESIKNNWRNSEAMERENGYAILGALLRGKIGAGMVISSSAKSNEPTYISPADRDHLGFQLLSLVLDFVGYKHAKPEDSFIVNPLAYRILLVDFDLWRKASTLTQKLYYKQFITFGVKSKYHQFNSRRLLRMRKSCCRSLLGPVSLMHLGIVRRFLDALKAENFSRDVMPSFMAALESLVRCNLTAEVLRSLALFVTYAYHNSATSTSRTPRSAVGITPMRARTISSGPKRPPMHLSSASQDIPGDQLTRRELGNQVLQMYTNLLCERGNTSNIKKFARTVTNKVGVVYVGRKSMLTLTVVATSSNRRRR